MTRSPARMLAQLEGSRSERGAEAVERRRELLDGLARRRLATAGQVARLHEVLSYLLAYPDDARCRARVETMLDAFASRGDLRRHRRALADTGLAGTDLQYPFFWPTARWLARRCPELLHVAWDDFAAADRLGELLPVLMPRGELSALESPDRAPREWIDLLKGPDETDAAFLIRRFAALAADEYVRERLYDGLDVPIRIAAGPGAPTRTGARLPGAPADLRGGPLPQGRPDLLREIPIAPRSVRALTPAAGRRVLDLAVSQMVTRNRDLDEFAQGEPRDVRLVDCGGGLAFAVIGMRCARRPLLESNHGFLTLRNGAPVGYGLTRSLFASTEIANNVFSAFRGGDAAWILARLLSMCRLLFGATAFTLDPYQLGYENEEGLRTGAWWFYYKLGFRPEDPDVLAVLERELARMRRDPRHRSSPATLERLSCGNMYLYVDGRREDVLANVDVGAVALRVARTAAARGGGDRERALRGTTEEAAALLGAGDRRRWTPGERLMLERWSPLIVSLPGVRRWSPANRRALRRVVRAKGAVSESSFVRLFDGHRLLRRAVSRLAAG